MFSASSRQTGTNPSAELVGARLRWRNIASSLILKEDLGQLSLAFSFASTPRQTPQGDKSQKQRGRDPKEDIFTNPVARGVKCSSNHILGMSLRCSVDLHFALS